MSRSFLGFGGKSSIVPVVSNFLDNFVIAIAVGHVLKFCDSYCRWSVLKFTSISSLNQTNALGYAVILIFFLINNMKFPF